MVAKLFDAGECSDQAGFPARRHARRPGRILRLLMSGALLGLVFAVAYPFVAEWSRSLGSFQSQNRGIKRFEVAIGTKVGIPRVGGNGAAISVAAPCFLLSVSDCGTCGIAPLDLQEVPRSARNLPVLLVFEDEASLPRGKLSAASSVETHPSFLPAGMRFARPQGVQLDSASRVVRVAIGGEAIKAMLGTGGKK